MSSPNSPLPPTTSPGLSLGPSSTYTAGPGTHTHNGQIIASLIGKPTLLPFPPKSSKNPAAAGKPTITIRRLLPSPTYGPTPSAHVSNTNVLPTVASLVLARVLRVRQRQVDLGILCVSPPPPLHPTTQNNNSDDFYYDNSRFHVCSEAYPATIRREDIRATEKDKVVCAEMYRPGDVVKAEVISLGDSANYYCMTGRNELGVLMARSERSGKVMAPVSWREFDEVDDEEGDEGSGLKVGVGGGEKRREGRKVAKPF